MSFIGVIAKKDDEIIIKNILKKKFKKHTIIAINNRSIENIRNIRFETVLVMSFKEVVDKEDAINLILKNTKYLVINTDTEESLEVMNNMKLNIITFGFNQKATITTSSTERNLMICVQRRLLNIDKNVIEPQEIKVKISEKMLSNNMHNSIGIASILLIYGKKEIIF